MTIEREFSSIGNLKGFVVRGKEPNAKDAVIYADKGGQYLLMGTLVNNEGLSLTHQDYVRYVPNGLPGTPVLIYKTADGSAHIWVNTPEKQELDNLVQSIGNSF